MLISTNFEIIQEKNYKIFCQSFVGQSFNLKKIANLIFSFTKSEKAPQSALI